MVAQPDVESVPVVRSADEALELARAYAASIAPGAADRDRAGTVPRQELAELDGSGLLAITVPVVHGGAGVSTRTLAEVIETIAAADPSIAQVPQGHFLFVDVVALHGSRTLQDRVFAEILAGARIGSALAERGTKHAQDLRTRLWADAHGTLRLSGKKYYCTGAVTAHRIAVSALDEQGRLVVGLVERAADGVTVDEDWAAMGQRATVSGTTGLADVQADPAFVIPYWQAFERPQLLGARAQVVHAAIDVGIAVGALQDAGDFVRTRSRPSTEAVRAGWTSAAEDPHTLLRYGRLVTQVRAARELLRWAADVVESTWPTPPDVDAAAQASLAVAQAKAFAAEVSLLVASDLFALTGTSGTDLRFDLDRHWRNARTHTVHDPADWKYRHIGAYALSGTLPPNHGQL